MGTCGLATLVFNMNISTAKDYKRFSGSDRGTAIASSAEMPVGYTDAGAVSKTTEFTFVIDKVTSPLRVKCSPGGTRRIRQSPTCGQRDEQARPSGRAVEAAIRSGLTG